MTPLTVPEAAARWHVSARRVRQWIEQGRVAGAVRVGRDWMIPARAAKPKELRRGRKAAD